MKQEYISVAARDVLANATIKDTILYLPPAQLARPLYEEVNDVLTRLGGKWKSGKVKGHIFDADPTSDLAVVIQTGLMPPKNPTAFFPTPSDVIERMLHDTPLYEIVPTLSAQQSVRILEPSAGKGMIAKAIRTYVEAREQAYPVTLHCCEIVPAFAAYLRSESFTVVAEDFLAYQPEEPYHAILMNPPFAVEDDRSAYITHMEHAWSLLAPGGILIAIVPGGFQFRTDKRIQQFRSLIEQYGTWDAIDDKAFHESGTDIKTMLVWAQKPDVPVQSTQEPHQEVAQLASSDTLEQASLW